MRWYSSETDAALLPTPRLRSLADEQTLSVSTRCWHCAFPNIAGNDRHTLHLRYCPFWVKQAGTVVASAAELSRRGALDTPIKRQLMGLEDRDGTNWYDAEFALAHPRPDLR